MTRQHFPQHSASSSLSTGARYVSPRGLESGNSGRTQTLLARLFRRKECSPSSFSPSVAPNDATSHCLYGEEEETKTNVESPIRTLLRSLSLQHSGRNRLIQTSQLNTLQVVLDGVLTEVLYRCYWQSKPRYYVLEQTVESNTVKFTLRQFQYVPESKKASQVMTIITLSHNDSVTNLRTYRQVKYALELQLATCEQRTDIGSEEECDVQRIRLAAGDERTHLKWLHTLNTCISMLVAQEMQCQSKVTSTIWTESAKIMPLCAERGYQSKVLATKEREQVGRALSCTSSECSNNNHTEEELPTEETCSAKKDAADVDEDKVEPAVCGFEKRMRLVPVVATEELPDQTVDNCCCTPKYRLNDLLKPQEIHFDNNAIYEQIDNNDENNQGDDESDEDFGIGYLATQSSVAPYKSAVLAGKGISPYQSVDLEDEYAKYSSISTVSAADSGRLPCAAFGSSSSSLPLLRPQTHSFNANGQVFTLDTCYELVRPIGNGAYGAVIAVKDVVNGGDHLAVKKISNIFEDLVDAKRILREVRLLHHFKHKNITRLVDISPPPSRKHFDDMYIITELMETDLHQVIYSMQPMSDDHVKYFLYQMLCALHHIHSAGVLHRDVKPSNILLNANCDLKMCDFGLARGGVKSSTEEQQDAVQLSGLTEYVVTRWYRAPEIMLNCLSYTTAIDVWAAGCIFAEMFLREPLFPGNDYLHQLKLIIKFLGTPKQEDIGFVKNTKALRFLTKLAICKPKKWQDVFAEAGAENFVNVDAIDLLSKMLFFNPEKRISVDAALQHPYLASFFDEKDLVISRPFDFSFDLPDDKLSKDAIIDLLCEDIAQFHSPVPVQ